MLGQNESETIQVTERQNGMKARQFKLQRDRMESKRDNSESSSYRETERYRSDTILDYQVTERQKGIKARQF